MLEIKEPFAKRLQKAMGARNIRPIDICKKTGLSESTISQYRSGYAKPKNDRLALLANALQVDPAWLMGLDVPMERTIADIESVFIGDEDTFSLIQIANKLDDIEKARLLAYGQALLDSKKERQ